MKQNYLFTDLDRTMIFSKTFYEDGLNLLPIEYDKENNKKIISYMTKNALELVKKNQSNIIPVTTRTLSEFQRVTPFQDSPWAIVGNGSLILHKGKKVNEWSIHIDNITKPLSQEYDFLINFINFEFKEMLEEKAKKNEGFIFAKIKEEYRDYFYNKIFAHKLPHWQFVIQKRKVYLMPKIVSKENAVEYVLKKLVNVDNLFFAGDGVLDVGMLNLSSKLLKAKSFAPIGSDAHKLSTTKNLTTVPLSPIGGEIILQTTFKEGKFTEGKMK